MTIRNEVKKMTTNRLQYLINLCAEEMQRRISKLEMEAAKDTAELYERLERGSSDS